MTNEEIADHCGNLAKAIMDAAQKWCESMPGSDGDKIKVLSCTFARIAAENAKMISGGDKQKALGFLLSALADAYGAKLEFVTRDESESPETFQGRPIVGHC